MGEHLTIRNFGPIREAEIDVKPLTVFVGPQATGKSLAAQLLYFLRGSDELIERLGGGSTDQSDGVKETREKYEDNSLTDAWGALELWLGNRTGVYSADSTEVCWSPDGKGRFCITPGDKRFGYSSSVAAARPRQMYLPAFRGLFSFLPTSKALRFMSQSSRRGLQWQGSVELFYEHLLGAVERLRAVQARYPEAGSHPDDEFVRQRRDVTIRGQIEYGPESVMLNVEGRRLRAMTMASGQQEIWPFWTMVDDMMWFQELDTRVYFDEPEAHLHPSAQRAVVEVIGYLVNRGTQFVITTHSPYVLYVINNLLAGRKHLEEGGKLPDRVPSEAVLSASAVAAYRFDEAGFVESIFDDEVDLINEDELNRTAQELGAQFSEMLDRREVRE